MLRITLEIVPNEDGEYEIQRTSGGETKTISTYSSKEDAERTLIKIRDGIDNVIHNFLNERTK